MPTPCTTKPLEFEGHESRRVVAAFDGGPITSDAGALLLRQVEQHLSLIDQVADCFHDTGSSHACHWWSVLQEVRGREVGCPGSLAEVEE